MDDDVPPGMGDVDAPDLSLKTPGLREDETKEITSKTVEDSLYTSAVSFEELPISKELLQGLYEEMKYEKPSRIQAKTLPMILTPPYRHLIAQAHNGSGKTTCFVLSMLSRVDPGLPLPQAMCVCPTRELVIQNIMVLEKMGKFTGITAASTTVWRDRKSRVSDQVVIGTHGRLKDWVSKRMLQIDNIRILVYDEADEMMKMDGFAADSTRLIESIRKVSPEVQILLFSATFDEAVKNFCMKKVPNANHVFVPKEDLSLDVIKQYKVVVPHSEPMGINEHKIDVLRNQVFPNAEKLGQTIIFVERRETARKLHQIMNAEGYKCTSLDGGMDHADRDRVVTEFRTGVTKILIATNVLARGFDVQQVTLVINFDLPTTRQGDPAYDTYMHRIGRSGRFGRKGAAFNLCCGSSDEQILGAISTYFKHAIPEVPFNDEEGFIAVLKEAGLTED